MTMDTGEALQRALALIAEGHAAEASRIASEAIRGDPGNARAHLVAGVALRLQGALGEARAALERAAALDGSAYAPAFELGLVLELTGDAAGALAWHRKAIALRPDFAPARLAAGRLLADAGRGEEALDAVDPVLRASPGDPFALHEKGWILHRGGKPALAIPLLEAAVAARPDAIEWRLDLAKALADRREDVRAREHYESAIRAHPPNAQALVAYGRFCVSRGDFAGAAQRFEAALALAPGDPALPIYLAQAELVQGHWDRGWRWYARREPRRNFASARKARGLDDRVPRLAEAAGEELTLVGEQGLGDVLFHLRYAPALALRGARLAFAGDARLIPLLRRAGIFRELRAGDASTEAGTAHAILTGDLPSIEGMEAVAPSLRIAPDRAREDAWKRRLEAAGPRPWIGVTWRAGTPSEVLAHGLFKSAPLDRLMAAIAPLGGTVFALQREPKAGEIDAASAALGARVHDLSAANGDLEDALAVLALLDRHVGVSNTNMHLAALAGKTADVLVPFPPEWRWGAAGPSPWFPGFRVHRQEPGGDWSAALAALAASGQPG